MSLLFQISSENSIFLINISIQNYSDNVEKSVEICKWSFTIFGLSSKVFRCSLEILGSFNYLCLFDFFPACFGHLRNISRDRRRPSIEFVNLYPYYSFTLVLHFLHSCYKKQHFFFSQSEFCIFFFKCFRPLARAYVFQTKDFSRQCEAKVLLLVLLGSGIQVLPCRRHTCNCSIVSDLILGIVSLIIYNEVCGSLGNARRVLYILYGKEPLTLNSSSFRGRIQSYRKPDSCVSYSLLTLNQEPFSKKPHFSQPYL